MTSADINDRCGALHIEVNGQRRYLDGDTPGHTDVVTRPFENNATQRWCFHTTNPNTTDPMPGTAGGTSVSLFSIRHGSPQSLDFLDANEDGNNRVVLRPLQRGTSQKWQVRPTQDPNKYSILQFSSGDHLSVTTDDEFRAVILWFTDPAPHEWTFELE